MAIFSFRCGIGWRAKVDCFELDGTGAGDGIQRGGDGAACGEGTARTSGG